MRRAPSNFSLATLAEATDQKVIDDACGVDVELDVVEWQVLLNGKLGTKR